MILPTNISLTRNINKYPTMKYGQFHMWMEEKKRKKVNSTEVHINTHNITLHNIAQVYS
jgi:hypothetical protein